MNILLTGGSGFIGSHLSNELLKDDKNKLIIVDNLLTGNLENIQNLLDSKNVTFIQHDVQDHIEIDEKLDYVLHLAALIGIPYSYISPLAYLKTNVEGTYNILEASKNLNIKNVIITSTSEVYGSAKYMPIDEFHQLSAQSPYAASKIAADQLSLSFYRSFNLPVKIIRPFNTYGPRQSSRAIIPRIISQCLNNKKEKIILGNLNPTRDFNYVEDICNSYFHILKNKKLVGHTINIGSNTNISIKNLVKKIMKITNVNFKIHKQQDIIRKKLSEVENLKCNNKKVLKFTKWKPKIDLEDGLINTIKWIKKNESKI